METKTNLQRSMTSSDKFRLPRELYLPQQICDLKLQAGDVIIIQNAAGILLTLDWEDVYFLSRIGLSKRLANEIVSESIDITNFDTFRTIHNCLNEHSHGLTPIERKSVGPSSIALSSWLFHKLRYQSCLNQSESCMRPPVGQLSGPSDSTPFQLTNDEENAVKIIMGSLAQSNLIQSEFEFGLRIGDRKTTLGLSVECAKIDLTDEQHFRLVNNSLNEVCWGLKLSRSERDIWFSVDVEFLRAILARLHWEWNTRH